MNATVCPINPPGHDWEAGFSCRWCDATRTPSEAVLSGLASVRGWSREAARAVHDAYRTQVLAEVADYFEQRRPARADLVSDFDRGRRATVGWVVEELREKAGAVEEATATAATATPEFFQVGHTYTREHHAATIRFLVRYVDESPCGTYRIAFGWRVEDGDVTWSPSDSDDMGGWVDVTETEASRG